MTSWQLLKAPIKKVCEKLKKNEEFRFAHGIFELGVQKSTVVQHDNQNSRNTGVSGVFSCPKTGFSLIFSLIGSTGGNCTDKTLHAVGTFALHLIGHMAIHVQCKGCCGVTQITLHCFNVVSGADRGDCVGVP